MLGLAGYVMRGRLQALIIVIAVACSTLVLSTTLCWISAAVVALVTLRKGLEEGAWVLLWALLPAGLLLFSTGDSGPLAMLLGSSILAVVLRNTVNLSVTILSSVAIGGLTAGALLMFSGALLEELVGYVSEFLGNMEQQLSQDGNTVSFPVPTALLIAGMLGLANSVSSVLCMLLARYWQAELYNPGGFGKEFKAVYLSPVRTAMLVLPALGIAALGSDYQTWAMIFLVPLSFAGLALVHARAEVRKRGVGWLTVFYLAYFILDPVKLVVVIAAIADSWIGFRQRWAKESSLD